MAIDLHTLNSHTGKATYGWYCVDCNKAQREALDPDLEYDQEIINPSTHTYLLVKCPKCNYEWEVKKDDDKD